MQNHFKQIYYTLAVTDTWRASILHTYVFAWGNTITHTHTSAAFRHSPPNSLINSSHNALVIFSFSHPPDGSACKYSQFHLINHTFA